MVSKPVYCRAFIGREQQLDLLAERCRAVESGQGSVVLISGEAGMGKTRLMAEFSARTRARGIYFVAGHCFEYARSPFAPFLRVLRAIVADDPALWTSAGTERSVLVRLLPELAEARSPIGAYSDGDKLRQLDAMAALLERFASKQPTAVLIEDLHWADAASLELLLHLLPTVAGSRILLATTYRPDEVVRGHPLERVLAKLDREPTVWRTDLEPLDDAQMQAFIFHALEGHDPLPAQIRREIRSQAEGNPLFAEELLRSAVDGIAAGRMPRDLPLSIREAVLARLARFDDRDRSILMHAAAIGRRFRAEFLADTVDLPLNVVLSALKRAIDLQLLVEEVGGAVQYTFHHELARTAIYRELLAAETIPLHAKIATALELSDPSRIAELAYHWFEAHDRKRAAQYCELAGDAALRVYAYQDAAHYYEHALECGVHRGADRAALLERLGRALHEGGMGERSRHILEAALQYYESAGDMENAARMCLWLSGVCWNIGDIETEYRMVERALALTSSTPASPASISAHLEMAGHLAWVESDTAKVAAYFAQLEPLQDSWSDRQAMYFFEYRSQLQLRLGNTSEAYGDVCRALQMVDEADTLSAARCWSNFGNQMAQHGERELAFEASRRALEIITAKTTGTKNDTSVYEQFALALVLYGELLRAREFLMRSLAANVDILGFRLRNAEVGAPLGLMLEDDDLIAQCAQPDLLDAALRSGRQTICRAAIAFGKVFVARGEAARARELLHCAIEGLTDVPPVEGGAWMLFIMIAEHGDIGDLAHARELLQRFCGATKTRVAQAYPVLFEAYAAARSNDRRKAEVFALEAARIFGEIGWPYYEARSLEIAGRLTEALQIYRGFGDRGDARRVEAILTAPNRRGRKPAELSSREREIAELVAAGKSNRAIASQLVISSRTVENHLASIFGKLNIGSRAELAAYVAREQHR